MVFARQWTTGSVLLNKKKNTFTEVMRLLFNWFVKTVFERSEPIWLYLHFNVFIDVIQHFFYVLNRLIYSLLLSDHLFLTTSPHHSSLLNQIHNFLFLFRSSSYNFLLLIIIIKNKLARTGLNLKTSWRSLLFIIVRVIVIFNHEINVSIEIIYQFVTVVKVKFDKKNVFLLSKLLPL